MLDFEIEQETLPVIKINFDEMKVALSEKMEQYKGIIVTEENLSICKADLKQLAGLRSKIDTFRKEKKREMSAPITEFEGKCKELISLIENVEKPTKGGIKVFDDKKREEKRQKALELIQESVQAHELNEKYASKLTVLDKYMNLSASVKSVKEDIEQRVYVLVQEQAKEQEIIQIVKTTIENVNKEINTPIKYEDFKNLVERGYSVPEIINRINQMAAKIKLAENPPKEPEVINPQPTAVPEPVEVPQVPPVKYHTEPINPVKVDEPLYFVSFKITGNVHQTAAIGQFLRDNKIKYEVLDKGAVK